MGPPARGRVQGQSPWWGCGEGEEPPPSNFLEFEGSKGANLCNLVGINLRNVTNTCGGIYYEFGQGPGGVHRGSMGGLQVWVFWVFRGGDRHVGGPVAINLTRYHKEGVWGEVQGQVWC